MNGSDRHPTIGVLDPAERLFAAAVLVVGGIAALAWAGAALATFLSGGGGLGVSLADALTAVTRLPGRLTDPASAWPAPASEALPGPVVYWAANVVVATAVAAVTVTARRLWRPQGGRDGLGVERSARFASRRDLRRLAVPGPVPGRIVLGRVGTTLVATEERTGVCVVGPSQSGKTSGLCVPALLELGKGGGSVIAASVKGDLHEATGIRRGRLGDVKVFDPTCVLVERSATWSPLRAADTVTGAQAAARGLVEVAGRGRLEDADFWMDAAKELLWPLMFVAARSGDSMADVVRWVLAHDRPLRKKDGSLKDGEVGARLRALDKQRPPPPPDGQKAPVDEVSLASHALGGLWSCDERSRSSIYTTARTVIEAWSDPVVAQAAAGCEITPEWLLAGDNTLYVVAPARDQARLRPVFASLVADLVNTAFEAATRKGRECDQRLLVLLDEAANICPVKELPTWSSTCASHGITLVTVWQDRSQQRLRYGPEGAETIWNNSGAKVVLSGLADRATAELTSLLGEEEHERVTHSLDVRQDRRSVSTQTATRRLVSEDSLRRQQQSQALLVYRDLPPARLTLRPYHEDPALQALQRGD